MMKHSLQSLRFPICLALLAVLFNAMAVRAFPPAPYHLLYGQVRDEFGRPLFFEGSHVRLQAEDGARLRAPIYPGALPGANYRLPVPMDAGLTLDKYKPTALHPHLPFQIIVVVDGVDYLPIEARGDLFNIGEAGRRTRLDLTLGEDADGDGLPDAWERLLNREADGGVDPDGDEDGDGLSNRQEYLAGSMASDPEDGFNLKAVGVQDAHFVVEFMALRGRTYTVHGSTDLKAWKPLLMREVPASAEEAAESGWRERYLSEGVDRLEFQLRAPEGADGSTSFKFFRLQVQ